MRFSAAVQHTAPRAPEPVAVREPSRDQPATARMPADQGAAHEVPSDLDQRVRLSGEW